MIERFAIFFALAALAADAVAQADVKAPVDYVNPFIGCVTDSKVHPTRDGYGKTFPGAATPYGLVQLSPDSITGGDNGSGYNFEHTTLQGFSFTHLSGVGWYGDLGNFLVMPTIGPLKTSYGEVNKPGTGYLSRKAEETASAGYYAVTLADYGIRAELTAAPHSGMLRFTFPANEHARIQVDLARRVGGTAVAESVKVAGDNAIEGWMRCTPEGGGWGDGNGHPNYTVYFHAEFSKPITHCGVWEVEIPDGAPRKHQKFDAAFLQAMEMAKVIPGGREKEGKHIGFYTEFATTTNEQVLMKAGISFASVEGARKNLQSDMTGWDFDAVRNAARDQWNRELSRINVEGGTPGQRTIFYTAMYHAMIDPRCFADVDGTYPGGDTQRTPKANTRYTRRTVFSGWDVYRSEYPLMTLIAPQVVGDMIDSLTDLGEESGKGYLERWEFLDAYSGCMNGNPAVVVMADAYTKGLRNFDVEKAYRAALATSQNPKTGNNAEGYRTNKLAETQEINLADWGLAQVAAGLGQKDEAARLLASSRGWRHFYDAKSNWFAGEGRESNLEQQGWYVPHDIPGLIEQIGGRENFISRLDNFFKQTPDVSRWNDFYNHANEPVHLLPFFFNRAGAPWLTQKWVRFICEHAYGDDPYGICGNDDVGQMSAWYVLAACGIHQACPGDPRYEVFTPIFDRVEIRIDPIYGKGRKFTVIASGNGPGERYIKSAKLNGKPLDRCWLDHSEIVAGGTLELQLAGQPTNWGGQTKL
jgi:predicted alpha-1,2-mannosidase